MLKIHKNSTILPHLGGTLVIDTLRLIVALRRLRSQLPPQRHFK
ncbi:MAG TPA: hypothetical protein VLL52_19715 [Anaerolineae bacterium]|nr:hypothetical protein [Anaerolineae bacterium]